MLPVEEEIRAENWLPMKGFWLPWCLVLLWVLPDLLRLLLVLLRACVMAAVACCKINKEV